MTEAGLKKKKCFFIYLFFFKDALEGETVFRAAAWIINIWPFILWISIHAKQAG